jgi:hypothetical protein
VIPFDLGHLGAVTLSDVLPSELPLALLIHDTEGRYLNNVMIDGPPHTVYGFEPGRYTLRSTGADWAAGADVPCEILPSSSTRVSRLDALALEEADR